MCAVAERCPVHLIFFSCKMEFQSVASMVLVGGRRGLRREVGIVVCVGTEDDAGAPGWVAGLGERVGEPR